MAGPRARTATSRCLSFVALLGACALLTVVGCSSSSPSRELAHDASRDTVEGPRPTAPPSTEYAGPGLSTEATQLLKELRELQQEKSLCEILGAKTIRDVLEGDLDTAGLVTTPSGIAQVLVTLDSFFQHIVDVSPPAVRTSTEALQQAWKDISAIEPDALDREQRTEAILSAPQIQLAGEQIGRWMAQNCAGLSASPMDLSSLLGGLVP